MPSSNDREPMKDEAAGMKWWNSSTLEERRRWMRVAGDTGRVSDAWNAYKQAVTQSTTRKE